MIRTHVILDGLQDPVAGRALSARWSEAGFDNAVDIAGQCAWLSLGVDIGAGGCVEDALTESDVDRAAAMGREFGVELRDRVGKTFQAKNELASLRGQMVYEYKSRFATAVVFGLPALGLHYMAPVLAGGGGEARWMAYPWLLELLLVGWSCLAAGWPILWQGMVALVHLRATGDLLVMLTIGVAFVPSAVGGLSLVVTGEPWFGAPLEGGGPAFHAAVLALMLAVGGRWLVYRFADRLSGRANLMLAGFGRLIVAWLGVSAVVMVMVGWEWGLAFAMLMPSFISLGAINHWSPGWSVVLPVVAFGGLFLGGEGVVGLSLEGVQIEAAAGFGLMMTLVLAVGWSRLKPIGA